MVPMWFFLNLYPQQVLGFSAFPAGAALLPMTALIMIGMIVLAPRVTARFGTKVPIVAGLVVLTVGLGWMSLIRPDGNYWIDAFGPSLVVAFGQALAFIPSLQVAISAGFSAAFLTASVIALLGAVVTLMLFRGRQTDPQVQERELQSA